MVGLCRLSLLGCLNYQVHFLSTIIQNYLLD
nr:MAG TPA: hypothetical protein [Bacteriophage sp.]